MTVNLRCFAAVAEAAGMTEESVSLPVGATVRDLHVALIAARGVGFVRQLVVSTPLIDGAYADGAAFLSSGAVRTDVLLSLVDG